jgi:histidinol-phosphatase
MDRRVEVAIAAAKAGGAVALKYFGTDLSVDYKGDRSPVTRADRECEQHVADVLRRSFPDYGIIGEEFGEREGRGARWIIDPIDGTKNFIRGIPYFATLVGLEEEGEIVAGVIHAPASGDLLYAHKGGGAFDQHGRIRVSSVRSLRQGMIVFGGIDIFRKRGKWRGFERLVRAAGRERGFGDYFGHTFVARGQAEVMVELDLKPWDLAPIKIIVEEAGGRFSDFAGAPTIYGGDAIASNGFVHEEVLELLEGSESGTEGT